MCSFNMTVTHFSVFSAWVSLDLILSCLFQRMPSCLLYSYLLKQQMSAFKLTPNYSKKETLGTVCIDTYMKISSEQ